MHDAAIEAGLVARPERVVTDDEFNLAYRDELAAQVERMKADRSVAELEQLEEDGEDDDEIIAQLRQKRIEEIKQARTNKMQQGREVQTQQRTFHRTGWATMRLLQKQSLTLYRRSPDVLSASVARGRSLRFRDSGDRSFPPGLGGSASLPREPLRFNLDADTAASIRCSASERAGPADARVAAHCKLAREGLSRATCVSGGESAEAVR